MRAGILCRAMLGFAGVAGALFLPLIPASAQKLPPLAPGAAATTIGSVSQLTTGIPSAIISGNIAVAPPLVEKPGPFTGWTVTPVNGRDYVPLQDVASFYDFVRQTATLQSVILSKPDKILQGNSGAWYLSINNLRFALGAPLVDSPNGLLISRRDLAKTVDPVMRPWRINGRSVRTVILDAGHGGVDNGTWSSVGSEKIYTLDVAGRAAILLQQLGYQVVFTRTSDIYVEREERVRIANQYRDGIFISIHFNAGPARGIETYCLTPQGFASTDNHPSPTDLQINPGNALDPENVALATTLHASILKHVSSPDRGVRRARFEVLRNITIPGVLVEGGYLSGGDMRSIMTPAYRDGLAQGIAEAVQHYAKAVPAGGYAVQPQIASAAADQDQKASNESSASQNTKR